MASSWAWRLRLVAGASAYEPALVLVALSGELRGAMTALAGFDNIYKGPWDEETGWIVARSQNCLCDMTACNITPRFISSG